METREKEVSLYKLKDYDFSVFDLIDAHCHLDQLTSEEISDSLKYIDIMLTNSVDLISCIKNLKLVDNKHIFALMGIHPEFALKLKNYEIDYIVNFIRENKARIKGIGEIGLDYSIAKNLKTNILKQKRVFAKMLKLANELDLPVSVHSRDAIDTVLDMLHKYKIKKAHIHFFEGDEEQAMRTVNYGYMISIPPLISKKRVRAIKSVPIEMLMAETDSPTAGSLPKNVIESVKIIAEAKNIDNETAAKILTHNTKRFFNLNDPTTAFLRNSKK